ncbi:proline-rich transmembrane protein 1-like [Ruditapes philippinarum]|uniref:proline-rich transmembrane protein 1-like n=1 Tax=Ruditapes philippinarum TaxID=129788 RepID=UPI00295B0519|nr:proline-rich transmembrane protein 1-like [Ruditapes philippinarum]
MTDNAIYPSQPAYVEHNKGGSSAQPGFGQTTTVVMTQPGYAGQVVAMPRPPDYICGSIFACLCCFWPTGLLAIFYAYRARKLAAEGDMVGATSMANYARNLMITSIVIGVIWVVFVIVFRLTV